MNLEAGYVSEVIRSKLRYSIKKNDVRNKQSDNRSYISGDNKRIIIDPTVFCLASNLAYIRWLFLRVRVRENANI